jgi:hypothetical protein
LGNGKWLNIHCYSDKVLAVKKEQEVVGNAVIVTEQVNGRKYTRVDVHVHTSDSTAPQPRYEFLLSSNGECGSAILQCRWWRIVFKKYKPTKEVSPEAKPAPVAVAEELPFLSPEATLIKARNLVEWLTIKKGMVIPRENNKDDSGRACWVLYLLNKDERYGMDIQTKREVRQLKRSLEKYIPTGVFNKPQ